MNHSYSHACQIAGRIRRGPADRVRRLVGVRPELQLRRQTHRAGRCRRHPEPGIEAGRTAAPVPIDRDPRGAGEGVDQPSRLLPESRRLRLLSRRRVRLQPASPRVRATRRHHRPNILPGHRPGPTPARPQCVSRIRGRSIDHRGGSDPGELGQDVHGARGRPELSGDLRRRGSVSRRARARGVRERACESPEQPGRYVPSGRQPWHRRRGDRPACAGDYRRVSGTLSVLLSGGDCLPAAMACMSPRISTICRGSASTSSMRTFNSRPTRLASSRPIRRRPPLRSIGTRRRVAAGWPSMPASRSSSIAGISALVWVASRTGSPGRRSSHTTSRLVSLFGGTEFVYVRLPATDETRRLELPVTYTGDVAYHREKWSVLTEYSHGFMGEPVPRGPGVQAWRDRTERGRSLLRWQLVSLSRGWLQPDTQLWHRRSRLRHPDVPRAKPPRRVGHFLSLRQEVVHHSIAQR